MSRIGRKPVPVPKNVEVAIEGNCLTVRGPKGVLRRELHPDMQIEVGEGAIHVLRPSDSRTHRSLHGLTRSLVANMVEGVTRGYEKSLEIVGTGYRASKQGNKLVLQIGYSHPVEITPKEGIDILVPAPNKITVTGIDKESVGQTAADIRAVREPEPYQGKGIRYAGERVIQKAGKTGKVGK
ncbi:MAG: 50S ribosomal protein L6 [Firmicutes bacterium]|jgi:large subunit ribosomal protein L6|nr:50S ribosomal protein L6 [Bacillota bacterium]